MPINIEEIVERAFEQAFAKALDQVVQNKAEAIFRRAFEEGSPLTKKLEDKIDQVFERFIDEGVRWDKKWWMPPKGSDISRERPSIDQAVGLEKRSHLHDESSKRDGRR